MGFLGNPLDSMNSKTGMWNDRIAELTERVNDLYDSALKIERPEHGWTGDPSEESMRKQLMLGEMRADSIIRQVSQITAEVRRTTDSLKQIEQNAWGIKRRAQEDELKASAALRARACQQNENNQQN